LGVVGCRRHRAARWFQLSTGLRRCGVARDSALRGVATILCLWRLHPYPSLRECVCVFNSRSQPVAATRTMLVRSSRDTKVVLIIVTPDSEVGSRGPLRLTRVREGRRRQGRRPPMQTASELKLLLCFVSLLLKSMGRPSRSCGKLANSLGRPQTGGTGAAGLRPRVPGWLRACRNGPSQSKSCRDLQPSN